MSVKVFPPQATSATLAAAMAASLVGDWVEVSDDRGYTGRVLFEIIGPSFEPYRRLKTLQDVADEPAAAAVVATSADASRVIADSPSGLPIFAESLPVGTPAFGGFLGPVLDSSQSGAIPAGDKSTTPQRYRLIDMGRVYESPSTLQWKTTNDAGPVATNTVWDGLAATMAMISAGGAYPAAQFAAGKSAPADGASALYIPATWEMLALYWLFKPFTNNNYLSDTTGATFPFSPVVQGVNPLMVPQKPAFTATVPAQTALAAWQTSGAQAFQNSYYWTATEYSSTYAWILYWFTSYPGRLDTNNKTSSNPVRLVRRFVL